MGNGVSSRSAESPIPMEKDVMATGGSPSSEDEVPTSVSRGANQTNENLLFESERPLVRYSITTYGLMALGREMSTPPKLH